MSEANIPYLEFGSGPPLHFAHANAYPAGSYRQLLTALGAHYHVFAMEQRPLWSQQDPQELESWQLLADDLIRFVHEREVGPIIGAGHSLGAVVTMLAALKQPELFQSLILIEPVFLPPAVVQAFKTDSESVPTMHFVQSALKRRSRWPNRQVAFERFRRKSVFRRLSDDALWDYVNSGVRENENGGVVLSFPREWEARIYACPTLEVWELIPQISLPTLALRAEASESLQPGSWALWQSLQPEAHFVEISEAGHLVPLEKPNAVAQAMLQFLAPEKTKAG